MTFSKEFVIVNNVNNVIRNYWWRSGFFGRIRICCCFDTAIGSSIESSNVNLFVVLTGFDDMYAAVFISPSLSSLRFLFLLPRSVATIQRAATEVENYCGFN